MLSIPRRVTLSRFWMEYRFPYPSLLTLNTWRLQCRLLLHSRILLLSKWAYLASMCRHSTKSVNQSSLTTAVNTHAVVNFTRRWPQTTSMKRCSTAHQLIFRSQRSMLAWTHLAMSSMHLCVSRWIILTYLVTTIIARSQIKNSTRSTRSTMTTGTIWILLRLVLSVSA